MEGTLTFSSPGATAEFSKFAGIMSATLSLSHLIQYGVLIRPGEFGQRGTHRGDGDAGIRQLHENKAETEEMQPQPGDAWDHRELEEAGRSPGSQRERGPSVTWI